MEMEALKARMLSDLEDRYTLETTHIDEDLREIKLPLGFLKMHLHNWRMEKVRKVNVMHVASPKELKGSSNLDNQQLRKEKRAELEKICQEFKDVGIEARAHVYVGEKTDEIERAAKERKSTLVVLGSSGKSLWAERWIGSTPRDIAEKSPYPTLIIPLSGN